MHTNKFTNRLIHETSPYLLQHAHNPVDWYPWGNEALKKAQEGNKPILVSIGYSACHWCHVMERESFEDEATAEIMNRFFINIKIDREERPDLDHIYMDAVQAMTGSGGWPLNVFLTPGTRPFYGGTYFPPVRAFNRMSWKETLESVHDAWLTRRDEIETQAHNLTEHIMASNSFGISKPAGEDKMLFDKPILQIMADNLLAAADKQWGGFGRAPKFPQTFSIQFLLRHHYFTGDETSLSHALLSLDKMIQGGIYDQLGGGFARYSTDEKWLAPHFEKMLYDNALLVNVLSEACQLTKQENYKRVIDETIEFLTRELGHPEGGFYSALDADSEGIEGKFYTWSRQEIQEVLSADADLFCAVYNVSEHGNWEHTNILWLPAGISSYADGLGISVADLKNNLAGCRQKLLEKREQRIRPRLDDKILLGWNALTITAICKAAAATGKTSYHDLAIRSMDFLEKNFRDEKGSWHHCWKEGVAKFDAFLDDYASLIQAYLQLAALTGEYRYLSQAREICERVIKDFSDEDATFFLFTGKEQQDVIVRKKEVYDGAIPSGNALMAENLFSMAIYFDVPAWRERAYEMAASLQAAITKYPTSFGVWATFVQTMVNGINEIVVSGLTPDSLASAVNEMYIPNKVAMRMRTGNDVFPLLRGKKVDAGKNLIYVCRDYSCKKPVEHIHELLLLLNQKIYNKP